MPKVGQLTGRAFGWPDSFRGIGRQGWSRRVYGSGGGGGSGASVSALGSGFFLAKLDPQLPEQIVGVDVARQVLAGFGVAEGLASPRIGDVRPGAGRGLVGIVAHLTGLEFLQGPDR